ncbi:Hypothetical protein FKW44_008025, partial [Caligus rogercresseyi]
YDVKNKFFLSKDRQEGLDWTGRQSSVLDKDRHNTRYKSCFPWTYMPSQKSVEDVFNYILKHTSEFQNYD